MLRAKHVARLAGERGLAGEQMVQRRAHRVDVGAGIDAPARPLLGRHVVGRSQKRAGVGHRQRFAVDDVAGQPEVRDLDPIRDRLAVVGREHGRCEPIRDRDSLRLSARTIVDFGFRCRCRSCSARVTLGPTP